MSNPAALLGAYRPGRTPLHRLPAGTKLLALMAVGITVVLVRGPVSGVVFLGLAVAVLASARAGLRMTVLALRGLLVMTLLLGAWHAWQNGWPRAVEVMCDLLGLVLLASALTATTAVDELIDTLVRALGPLRRFGAQPDQVALAVALMLRGIPRILAVAAETRDAALARGLERDPRARLTPLVIRVVAQARDTGQALQARGIGDEDR